MAMLIAWQAINAVHRLGSTKFTRGFLIAAPGVTIRDRLHRVMLAFYLGIGFAIVLLFMKTPRAQQINQANTRLRFSSFAIMCVWVVGTRVVFSMPLALSANWIFRLTEVRANLYFTWPSWERRGSCV